MNQLQYKTLNKEFFILNNKKIYFISGAPANLLFHVLNIYSLLRKHGSQYKTAEIPDENLKEKLNKGANIKFPKLAKLFIKENPQNISELIELFKNKGEYEKYLSLALKSSWENYYKDYWNKNGKRLNATAQNQIKNYNWADLIIKLEEISDEKFKKDIFIIGTESLAQSAMMIMPNICIGAIRKNGDFGFSHEGFHLLLKEKWAKNKKIKELIPKNWNDEGRWGSFWQKKFEQAIVVSLDSLIIGLNKSEISNYFKGCNVGDLERFFFNPMKKWHMNKQKESLADVIYKILIKNKKNLIEKYAKL